MANGRNINTFTSGFTIPGWATEAYKSTTSDIDSIVKEITGEIRAQRKDQQAFALDTARVAQNQERLNQADERFKFEKDRAEYQDEKDALTIILEGYDGTPEDIKLQKDIINSRSSTDNIQVTQLREGLRKKLDKQLATYNESRESIRSVFFDGLSDEDLKANGMLTLLDSYQKMNAKNPDWNKNLVESQILRDFGGKLGLTDLQKGESAVLLNGMKEAQTLMMNSKVGSKMFETHESNYNNLKGQLYELHGEKLEVDDDNEFARANLNEYADKLGLTIDEVTKDFNSGKLTSDAIFKVVTGTDDEEVDEGWLEGLSDYVKEGMVEEGRSPYGMAGKMLGDVVGTIATAGYGDRFLDLYKKAEVSPDRVPPNLAGQKLTSKRDVANESKKFIKALEGVKESAIANNVKNKKQVLKEANTLIKRLRRMPASENPLELWDDFMKNYGRSEEQVGFQIDAAMQLQNLLDDLKTSPY